MSTLYKKIYLTEPEPEKSMEEPNNVMTSHEERREKDKHEIWTKYPIFSLN